MSKKIVLFAGLLLFSAGAFAQDKIAYFNSTEVITAMPEFTAMQDSLQKTQNVIEAEMKILEEEYNKKYTAFMSEAEGLVESIKVRRMQEIQDIAARAETFQQQSREQFLQLQEQLLTPIKQKVQDTLKAVGTENNYTYILEIGQVLYFSPSAANATPQVKAKLGLK
ncbi:hypothetical protein AGMMS50262_15260 [Bacteroidia bacterium]|nr:hypothetical protein AGMMS50262_15260 [Bacteroidia bacterium]